MEMIVKLCAVVLLSTGFSVVAADATSDSCWSLPPLNIAITGYRNDSAHWISQVVVAGGEGQQWREDGVQVDIQHRPVICSSGETTADIVLTFSVPSFNGTKAHSIARSVSASAAPRVNKRVPPSGYLPLQGVGYYKYSATARKFSDARLECSNEGGDLANIDTPEKLQFVKTLGTGWAWIYLQERGTNGVYYTVNNQIWEQPTFLAWYPGQPNFPNGIDCVLLLLQDGRIGDTPCELPRVFICEIPW